MQTCVNGSIMLCIGTIEIVYTDIASIHCFASCSCTRYFFPMCVFFTSVISFMPCSFFFSVTSFTQAMLLNRKHATNITHINITLNLVNRNWQNAMDEHPKITKWIERYWYWSWAYLWSNPNNGELFKWILFNQHFCFSLYFSFFFSFSPSLCRSRMSAIVHCWFRTWRITSNAWQLHLHTHTHTHSLLVQTNFFIVFFSSCAFHVIFGLSFDLENSCSCKQTEKKHELNGRFVCICVFHEFRKHKSNALK